MWGMTLAPSRLIAVYKVSCLSLGSIPTTIVKGGGLVRMLSSKKHSNTIPTTKTVTTSALRISWRGREPGRISQKSYKALEKHDLNTKENRLF